MVFFLLFEVNNVKALKNKLENVINDGQYYKKIKSLCAERKKEFTFDWDRRVMEAIKG